MHAEYRRRRQRHTLKTERRLFEASDSASTVSLWKLGRYSETGAVMPLTCADSCDDEAELRRKHARLDRLSTVLFSIVFSSESNNKCTNSQKHPLTCTYLARSEGFEPPTF